MVCTGAGSSSVHLKGCEHDPEPRFLQLSQRVVRMSWKLVVGMSGEEGDADKE